MQIQESCYWYAKNTDEGQVMAAICTACKTQNPEYSSAWFWDGATRGYGDYDLNCAICNNPIYQRANYEQIEASL